MRNIGVSTDVFAKIWAARLPSEDSENEIISRVFDNYQSNTRKLLEIEGNKMQPDSSEAFTSKFTPNKGRLNTSNLGKIRWVDDVVLALQRLGGSATLSQIYQSVEAERRAELRSTPASLEATVRRTIEDHSSDSDNFRGPDLFIKIGRGEWGLR